MAFDLKLFALLYSAGWWHLVGGNGSQNRVTDREKLRGAHGGGQRVFREKQ
jgi:hypothetical protein